MDDGQVIPGLNENWTFAGAKPMEWVSGLCAAILFTEFFVQNMGRAMPLILIVLVSVPILLATFRKTFPDEERGVRNCLMSILGLAPPGIPKPSLLQPVWSGAPMHEQPKSREYAQLGLDEIFKTEEEEQDLPSYFFH